MSKDVQWVHGTSCSACAEKKIETGCKHVRGGKTKFEHANGTHKNRFSNRGLRVEWGADPRSTNATFPRHACNGQKNRFA